MNFGASAEAWKFAWEPKPGRPRQMLLPYISCPSARYLGLPVVSRPLDHKRSSMTLRYAYVGDREIEAAAERIGADIVRALNDSATQCSA